MCSECFIHVSFSLFSLISISVYHCTYTRSLLAVLLLPRMSYSYSINRGDDVQLELVDSSGNPVAQKPVSLEELIAGGTNGVDVGNGYSVQLENLMDFEKGLIESSSSSSRRDETDEERDAEDAATNASGDSLSEAFHRLSPLDPPPGTEGLTDWYAILHSLRTDGAQRRSSATVGIKGSTPLQPLDYHSGEPEKQRKPPASRRDVWASLGPVADPKRDYGVMECVSVMRAETTRHFRPSALSFHAAASYSHPKDKGQRILLYGGLGSGGRNIEQEMYEFSLLSGNWKRVEGKNFVPAGHYGHTLTTMQSTQRVLLIGGVGPGGLVPSPTSSEDSFSTTRLDLLLPLCSLDHQAALRAPSLAPSRKSVVGLVPFVFDMNLQNLEWRALQMERPLTIAFHTTVAFGKVVFVFGGVQQNGDVSSDLVAVDSETFASRLIKQEPTPAPKLLAEKKPSPEATEGVAAPPALMVPVVPRLVLPANIADDTANTNTATPPPPTPVAPPARYCHTAVRYGHYMIVYGGFDAHNEPLADTWAFDMINETWEQLKANGSPRAGHSAAVVGNRMMVFGGFSDSLDSSSTQGPVKGVRELSLIPTADEEYRWRTVKSKPALPALAFSTCCSCGDHLSVVVTGGLLSRPKKAVTDHSGASSSSLTTRSTTPATMVTGDQSRSPAPKATLPSMFLTLDDALLLSFPMRAAKAVSSAPSEVPLSYEFTQFIRRQNDFLKKKEFNVDEAIRKVTLGEKEAAEPTLYLKKDEIEMLVTKGEELCVVFSSYSLQQLPTSLPDRELRIKMMEDALSLGRQTRDILKSMKGSEAGITAVKSKSHRQRGGQKFEDYSTAKPFRRFVVATFLKQIKEQLTDLQQLNKGLREVIWEEKGQFIAAVSEMQSCTERLSRCIQGVMSQYVKGSVEKLMMGVDRHKDVMKKLTEIVEQNEHDKIWGVQEARDSRRVGSPVKKSLKRVTVASPAPPVPAAKPRLFGQGYPQSQLSAVSRISEVQYSRIQKCIRTLVNSSETLSQCCQVGMNHVPTTAVTATPEQMMAGGIMTPSVQLTSLGVQQTRANDLRREVQKGAQTVLIAVQTLSHQLSVIDLELNPPALPAEQPTPAVSGPTAAAQAEAPPLLHGVALEHLQPLMKLKKRFSDVVQQAKQVPLVQHAAEPSVSLPSDEEMVKLTSTIDNALIRLLQTATSEVLAAMGARSPREKVEIPGKPMPKSAPLPRRRRTKSVNATAEALPSAAPPTEAGAMPVGPAAPVSVASEAPSASTTVIPLPADHTQEQKEYPPLPAPLGPVMVSAGAIGLPEVGTSEPAQQPAMTGAVQLSQVSQAAVTVSSGVVISGPPLHPMAAFAPVERSAWSANGIPPTPVPLASMPFSCASGVVLPASSPAPAAPSATLIQPPSAAPVAAFSSGYFGSPYLQPNQPLPSPLPGATAAAAVSAAPPPPSLPLEASADEDYFYFGAHGSNHNAAAFTPSSAVPVPYLGAAPSHLLPSAVDGMNGAAPPVMYLPTQGISPSVGAMPISLPTRGPPSSPAAAPVIRKSKMTPGERRIMEARERLKRR